MVKLHALLFLIQLGLIFNTLFAQQGLVTVDRSTTVEEIDGKEYYLHEVLKGQTLYSISRAYGVAVEAILQVNPELQDGLRYDQIIKIPIIKETEEPRHIGVHAPEPDGEYTEHIVSRRETLFGLSQKYGVPVEMILYYNPVARGGLKIGQLLRIPKPDETQELPVETTQPEESLVNDTDSIIIYRVLPGDTKYGISRRMDISIELLEEENPEIKEGLKAGQQIRIPLAVDSPRAVSQITTTDDAGEFITIRPGMHADEKYFAEADCLKPELKEVYDVALLLPFYVEELMPDQDSLILDDAGFLPEMTDQFLPPDTNVLHYWKEYWSEGISPDHKSFTFISYYQGVLLALDSIKQQGVNIRLHVHDVCNKATKASKLISSNDFAEMDLIIGPFHRQTLDMVAAFGKEHNIPVVSPLLPLRHQLDGLPNLFKVNTPLETMLNGVAGYISQNYPQQNILIVHNQQPGAAQIISAFRDTLLYEVAKTNYFYDSLNFARINRYFFNGTLVGSRQTDLLVMPDTVSVMLPVRSTTNVEVRVPKPYNVNEVIYRNVGMEGLKKQLRIDRENVLVTLISGEPFLSDYLRQLHKLRHDYDISVFGIPEWQDYSSIEFDYLQNLKVHIFVPFFFDYGDPHIQDFVFRFRQLFKTEPDNEALKAAHTAYFFFEALATYGKGFEQCMSLLNKGWFERPFSFWKPFGEQHGWENQHFHIYSIRNYRRVDVRKPAEFEISQRGSLQ